MLPKYIIRPSSPRSSHIVLITNKHCSLRFCVDYRQLNKVVKKDVCPMPMIDDVLDFLRRATSFSSLDLRSGYRQVPIPNEDKHETAFVTQDGLFEFNEVPFGLPKASIP